VRAAAWAALAIIVVELCAREVARRSLLDLFLGTRPGLLGLTISAALAAAAGIFGSRPAVVNRATAFVFAALFAAGVAA
jgi:hypothetical protein